MDQLVASLADRSYRVGVIGLGYAGLPFAMQAAGAGFPVLGFDINPERVRLLNSGQSGIMSVAAGDVRRAVDRGVFRATADPADLAQTDAINIAVPTPLGDHEEPDLTFVENSARTVAGALQPGQLVVLQSTTWPGTTREIVKPILESSGLRCGEDFFLAYSPEREDPGRDIRTLEVPRVLGADDPLSIEIARRLYTALGVTLKVVSSSDAAEAAKLTENIFRSVNIALANELKMVFARMGIDIWEVIDAAKTKPYGFMPFYPGPGVGGHCIPVDPFYLTWKAREFDVATRLIELAGQINAAMPHYVVDQLRIELDRRQGRGLNGAKVLVIGLAYKKNVDDLRESPALTLMDHLLAAGAVASFHDPHIRTIPPNRSQPRLAGMASRSLTADVIAECDAVVIATDHDEVDWTLVVDNARLIIDSRNACRSRGLPGSSVVGA